MSTETPKNPLQKFNCNCCYYYTNNKKDFNKHLSTDKHKKKDKSTILNDYQQSNPKNPKLYDCKCGKVYKERTGLWRHKQKCNKQESPQ